MFFWPPPLIYLFQVGAELDSLNKEECSPLMVACAEGKVNVVRYLLHVGADMTLRGHDGMTCLHLAAQNGHLECVHAILSQSRLPRKLINETVICLFNIFESYKCPEP